MYQRILVAVEHSRADEAILEHIVPLAKLTGAALLLVHVADGWAARHFDDLIRAAEINAHEAAAFARRLSETVRAAT